MLRALREAALAALSSLTGVARAARVERRLAGRRALTVRALASRRAGMALLFERLKRA